MSQLNIAQAYNKKTGANCYILYGKKNYYEISNNPGGGYSVLYYVNSEENNFVEFDSISFMDALDRIVVLEDDIEDEVICFMYEKDYILAVYTNEDHNLVCCTDMTGIIDDFDNEKEIHICIIKNVNAYI